MKRLPLFAETPGWRSLDAAQDRARIAPPDEVDRSISRRSFLQVMGASIALGSLAGCRRPAEHIYPFGKAPETVVPGRPQRYATSMPFAGTAFGVIVESHEGRPTKIEGNPLHPDSRGGASAFMQAAVLELYDPDRSTTPREKRIPRSWKSAIAALHAEAARFGDGGDLLVVTEAHRSPSLQAQLAVLRQRWPRARVVRYEALGRERARRGAALAFGRALDPVYALERADVIVALDADPFYAEGSAVKHARAFADRRTPGEGMNRLYALESAMSVTGAEADHRLRVRSERVYSMVLAIARELGRPLALSLPEAGVLSPEEARFVTAIARDLARVGSRGVLLAGEGQPVQVHALVHALNAALVSEACAYHAPFADDPEGSSALVDAAEAMRRGEVRRVVVLGGNPVQAAPQAARFGEALERTPFSVHLGGWDDETAARCTWHLPRAHWLESWGDVRAEDGTWSVIQPLTAPLHEGKSDLELVELLLGGTRSGHDIVQASWRAAHGLSDAAWRLALHDGLLADSAATPIEVKAAAASLPVPTPPQGLELGFRADAHAHDGRFANNAWLQELPDPITKLTWDNAALIAPSEAAERGLADGDVVELSVGGATLRAPILRAPGQARGTIGLTVGQGRARGGRVSDGAGYDAAPLRPVDAGFVGGATLRKTGERRALAITQEHDRMEERPLVREATRARYQAEPEFAKEPDQEHGALFNLWADQPYEGARWGMVIDLQRCVGCNACMVACQAENNIPVVGKDGVIRSREMHWIRVDRYFTGDADDPQVVMQPVGCQQCEQAPCEQVCPVGATTHSPEGLNDMAYNRCIGTRYCANNCPYKVRRYNFYNYNRDVVELRRMQFNPDVTVRSRGVMEKCSYCVQRINGAKIEAHVAGKERVDDGAIVTACQQGCPTQAIVFGDLADPASAISKRSSDPRRYVLLEELNIRPRTSFLARVRNPNPELG
jgi:molybdopterin-containing oxidoreductase family iron-sulfur binding subunit